jgi:Uma2 family endonuclease
MVSNLADQMELRRRNGADRWDEMWDGVLHMPPMPNRRHQDLEWAIEAWLRQFWVPCSGGKCYHQINVASLGGWPRNYRIPDVVLLTPDRFGIDKDEYFEGGPTVVVEIRTAGDETYQKFDFYAAIGVSEVWVVDRDTRRPEVYQLQGSGYEAVAADAAGCLASRATGVSLGASPQGQLTLQLAGNPASLRELP